jgi:hypothetical protein
MVVTELASFERVNKFLEQELMGLKNIQQAVNNGTLNGKVWEGPNGMAHQKSA